MSALLIRQETVNVSVLLCAVMICSLVSCGRIELPAEKMNEIPPALLAATSDDENLLKQLDEVLDFTLNDRTLNTADHDAWQIFHGVLAYQRVFPVRVGRDGPLNSAVDHILNGGTINGWDVQTGDLLDPRTGRYGLRAIMEPGSKSGQGHHDQWLAILAQSGLSADQVILVGDRQFTMTDYVRQVQRDVARNLEQEFSWTLIGLTAYNPTNVTWEASDGQTWSIRRLVELEVQQEPFSGACGGTHRLIGLSMALNHHLTQGGQLEGPWQQADQRLRQSIDTVRELQNPDGTFSTNYFNRPGTSADLADTIRTTGHTLEFLSLAMTDDELRQDWVKLAAFRLCDVFRKTKTRPIECGALYHAAHGLVLYRQRVFGPREYTFTTAIAPR